MNHKYGVVNTAPSLKPTMCFFVLVLVRVIVIEIFPLTCEAYDPITITSTRTSTTDIQTERTR